MLADGSTCTATSTYPTCSGRSGAAAAATSGSSRPSRSRRTGCRRLTVFSLTWPWSRADEVLRRVAGVGAERTVAAVVELASAVDRRVGAVGLGLRRVVGAPRRRSRRTSTRSRARWVPRPPAPCGRCRTSRRRVLRGVQSLLPEQCALSIDGGSLSRRGSLAKTDFFEAHRAAVIDALLGRIEDAGPTPRRSLAGGRRALRRVGRRDRRRLVDRDRVPAAEGATYLAQEFVTFGGLTAAERKANRHWLHELWRDSGRRSAGTRT